MTTPTTDDATLAHLDRGDLHGALATTTDPQLRISLLLELGRHAEAEALLSEECRRRPGDAGLWFALAHLRQKMGLTDEADEAYRQVRSLRPADASIRALTEAWFAARGDGLAPVVALRR